MRIAPASCALALTLVLAAGCAQSPAIDVEAEREALMAADRAWFESYTAADDPAAAFVAGTAEDVHLLAPDAPLAVGQEAVAAVIGQLEGMPGFSVTWAPDMARVGSGGDLGYTQGTYRMTMGGPDGPMTIDGKYLTIWEKQTDGSWLVMADMFNANGPPSM